MPIFVPDSGKCCLFLFSLVAIFPRGLGVFPGIARRSVSCKNARSSAAEGSDAGSDPPTLPDTRSLGSSDGTFLSRWATRGLRYAKNSRSTNIACNKDEVTDAEELVPQSA